jgi:hypothetical protein
MLRPAWLLTGYTLEIREPVTACGRDALRVVATPRPGLMGRTAPGLEAADRIEIIVDTELGILLRHEEIRDGWPADLTELENVSFDSAQAADDAQFRPPGGWEAVDENAEPTPPGSPGEAASGPAWEAVKLAAGLAAAGLAALIRRSPSDPFEQATQEEPEAEMPQDEPDPGDGSPVSDEVLHLLHRSEDLWAPGIVATLHQWHDIAAMFSQVPDGARKAGFGGLGSLLDVAGERMSAVHTVSLLHIAGPRTYRVDPDHSEGRPMTIICDGERRWKISDDEVAEGPAGPPPGAIASLLNSSWLLGHKLSGGSQTVIGGRRGYRVNVASDYPFGAMLLPGEVVVDAELGIVLRSTSYQGTKPTARSELRDVAVGPGEPGDFRPDIPPGTRVTEETDPAEDDAAPQPANLPGKLASDIARQAAKDAKSAVQGLFDLIRGQDAR